MEEEGQEGEQCQGRRQVKGKCDKMRQKLSHFKDDYFLVQEKRLEVRVQIDRGSEARGRAPGNSGLLPRRPFLLFLFSFFLVFLS